MFVILLTMKKEFVKLLKIYEEPLREISKLYNIVRSSENFYGKFSHDMTSKDLKPISSIMSFYCFILLHEVIKEKDWKEFFELKENKELKNWFNDWIDAIQNYHNKRTELIVEHVKN